MGSVAGGFEPPQALAVTAIVIATNMALEKFFIAIPFIAPSLQVWRRSSSARSAIEQRSTCYAPQGLRKTLANSNELRGRERALTGFAATPMMTGTRDGTLCFRELPVPRLTRNGATKSVLRRVGFKPDQCLLTAEIDVECSPALMV